MARSHGEDEDTMGSDDDGSKIRGNREDEGTMEAHEDTNEKANAD